MREYGETLTTLLFGAIISILSTSLSRLQYIILLGILACEFSFGELRKSMQSQLTIIYETNLQRCPASKTRKILRSFMGYTAFMVPMVLVLILLSKVKIDFPLCSKLSSEFLINNDIPRWVRIFLKRSE